VKSYDPPPAISDAAFVAALERIREPNLEPEGLKLGREPAIPAPNRHSGAPTEPSIDGWALPAVERTQLRWSQDQVDPHMPLLSRSARVAYTIVLVAMVASAVALLISNCEIDRHHRSQGSAGYHDEGCDDNSPPAAGVAIERFGSGCKSDFELGGRQSSRGSLRRYGASRGDALRCPLFQRARNRSGLQRGVQPDCLHLRPTRRSRADRPHIRALCHTGSWWLVRQFEQSGELKVTVLWLTGRTSASFRVSR
jgi:hypothetical protein